MIDGLPMLLAGLNWDWLNLPELVSRHGEDADSLVMTIHTAMLVLFVGWMSYLVFTLWQFRSSKHPRANPKGVSRIVFGIALGIVIVDEAVTLYGSAIPQWNANVGDFPRPEEATVLRVVAEQFTWNARYPGADQKFGTQDPRLVSSSNPLGYVPGDDAGKDDVVPQLKDIRIPLEPLDRDGNGIQDVDSRGRPLFKPVIIYLTSKDVVHSFKVIPLRVCQDAIPGMSIPIHFMPTKAGKYLITCAQLCGIGHATMNGWLTVMDNQPQRDEAGNVVAPGAFDRWQAQYLVGEGGGNVFE